MSKRTAPILLLTQNLVVKTADQNPVVRLEQPPYLFDWSDFEVCRWVLRVQSTTGSPTSFSVTPVFQYAVANTIDYQYMNPFWTDFDTNMNSAMQGGAWTAISSAGIFQRVVYDPPQFMRLSLAGTIANGTGALAFVGGTSPGLRCSLTVHVR